MFRLTFLAFALTLPTLSFAGSQSLDCVSQDKAISIGAGNSPQIGAKIQYTDKDGKKGVFSAPAAIQPDYNYSGDEAAKTLLVIPISVKRETSRKHEVMHIKRKDGTECYGRQRWDDKYVQTYVITGFAGNTLNAYDALAEKKVKGLNADGYLVTQLNCNDYGITTAGGCFVENDTDVITWEQDK